MKGIQMQLVSEIMTRQVQVISPQDTIRRAAQMMDELNVGSLPVCDGDRLVGMVTDRDITVRAISAGKNPNDAVVDEVMSTDVRWCFEDQRLDEVMQQMADTQIRRLPVISHDESHKLVGIVSLGDVATKPSGAGEGYDINQIVEKISLPSEPDLSGQNFSGNEAGGLISSMASETGTAAWLAGSDVAADQMNPGIEISSTADPSDMVEVTPNDLVNKNSPDSKTIRRTDAGTAQDRPVVVRREGNGEKDTTSGETGAPSGIDAGGPAGASGGMAEMGGTPGTGIGATPQG
jgi:CBS domain-containing protein